MNEHLFNMCHQLFGVLPFADYWFLFCADMLIFLIMVIGGVYLLRDPKAIRGVRQLFVVLFAALIAWSISEIINYVFPSPRPYVGDLMPSGFRGLGENASYPSGHTTFLFAFLTVQFFFKKGYRITFTLLALIVGFSRVVIGVHWPIDILGGIILGVSIGILVYVLYEIYLEKSNPLRYLMFWRKN